MIAHHNSTLALQVHKMALKWIDMRLGQIERRLFWVWTFPAANRLHLEQMALIEIQARILSRMTGLGDGVRKKELPLQTPLKEVS